MDLDEQRRLVAKSRAQGRRWILRAIILLGLGSVALYRGNSVNTMIGIALIFMAVMSYSLGKNMRKQASDLQTKIELMP